MTGDALRESVQRICARADRMAARMPAAHRAAMARYLEPEPDVPPRQKALPAPEKEAKG